MSTDPNKRDVWRRLSARTIFLHQAIADRLGLNLTDHKCLDILVQNGAMPAGKLAEASGLTTGAITGVVDRLERAGYVTRNADADDRRKTVIVVIPARLADISGLFAQLGERTSALLAQYGENEQAAITDFVQKMGDMVDDFVCMLKETS